MENPYDCTTVTMSRVGLFLLNGENRPSCSCNCRLFPCFAILLLVLCQHRKKQRNNMIQSILDNFGLDQ
jgi:hypothetical protein